jgi:hypothetical protein
MINVCGHLVSDLETWGWPWHGFLYAEESGGGTDYFLRKHNGEIWPMQGSDGPYLDPALLGDWAGRARSATVQAVSPMYSGVSTHLVKVAGNNWAGRSPEQTASDAARSHEWLPAAMITDGRLYSRLLASRGSRDAWIYSNAGEVWLMEIRLNADPPAPGANAALPLKIGLYARQFGCFGLAGALELVQNLEAPACLSGGGVVSGAAAPLMLQAIRSDGGHAILEMAAASPYAARLQRGAYGFYDLAVNRSGGTWAASLTLRMSAGEMYSKSVVRNDLRPAASWLGEDVITATGAYSQRTTSTLLSNPTPSLSLIACVGFVEQEQTRHCGWVYDDSDVLHEMECRIRVVHQCDVENPEPEIGGAKDESSPPGGPYEMTDTRYSRSDFRTEVITTITSEMLRDGVVVSSASAELYNLKEWREGSSPTAPALPGVTYTWRITVGDLTTTSTETISTNWSDWFSGTSGILWPVVGVLNGFFSQLSGGTLTPWPSQGFGIAGSIFEQQLYASPAATRPGALPTLTVGCSRQANNVWVPFVQAGRPGFQPNTWFQATTDTAIAPTLVDGLPASVFGPRVGPNINGPTPAAWSIPSASRRMAPAGSYDYLHGITSADAHIY